LQNPHAKICTFLMGVRTDSRLLFQTMSKSVQGKCPKGCVIMVTEKNKTRFGDVWRNPWGIQQFLVQVRTVVPQIYSRFHPNPFKFGGVITEKPFRNPHSDFNIGSLIL